MRKEIYNVENLIINENDTERINTEKIDAIERFKRNGNDINKYIFPFENNNQYLEEFPEYLAGYRPFATNTRINVFL